MCHLRTFRRAIKQARNEKLSPFAAVFTQGQFPTIFPLLRVSDKNDTNTLIALPLLPSQAELLMAIGKNQQTVGIIDASHLVCDNLEWRKEVNRVVHSDVRKWLGLCANAKICVRLKSLQISVIGTSIARHCPKCKAVNVFGTFIVSLPSVHRGGAFVADQGNDQYRFCTSTQQPTYFQWCGFFSGLNQQQLPVTEGHRAVLIYDLVYEGNGRIQRSDHH